MNQLQKIIIDRISHTKDQWISFEDWMGMVLYHPDFGYYCREQKHIGKKGDFFTNSHTGEIYGKTMAKAMIAMCGTLANQSFSILELGPGDGQLAQTLLDEIEVSAPEIYSHVHYYLLETSDYHQLLARQRLSQHKEKSTFIKKLQEIPLPFSGVVLANEFFDALALHMVEFHNGQWYEVGICANDASGISESLRYCSHPALLHFVNSLEMEPADGQRVEVNLLAQQWMTQISQSISEGFLVTVDYGYTDAGRFFSEHPQGTVRAFRQHQVSKLLLDYPGEQDITADVNFSSLMDAAKAGGLEPVLFESQKQFLVRMGILEDLQAGISHPFSKEARQNRAIMQLIMDEGRMGERFSVLIQKKGAFIPEVFKKQWLEDKESKEEIAQM